MRRAIFRCFARCHFTTGAERLARSNNLTGLEVEFDYLSLGGLSLMERMDGYKNVIVIDSIRTGSKPNGTIYSLPLSRLPDFSAGHTTAIHDTSLATALELGKRMGMVLPDDVWVVAVEAEVVFEFSEKMTHAVEVAVPIAVKLIIDLLKQDIREEKIYDLT